LIDFLVSAHPAAHYLLEHYIVKVVPMINIDGVVEGFYRTDHLSATDLNRVWTTPDPLRQPVVCAVKALVDQICRERKTAVYMDFHGHARLHGTFAYGCPNDEDAQFRDKEKLIPRMVTYLTDAFSWGHCVFSFPKERKAASRIVMRKEFGIVQSFTIESSFGGIEHGPRAGILYDETMWKELGAKCGEAMYHLLVRDGSPLCQYVEREFELLSPPPIADSEAHELDVAGQIEVQYAAVPGGECGMSHRARTIGTSATPSLLKLRQPVTFLVANARVISTDSPRYIAPRWSQMEFTPR
jgi:hypothetical protein